MDKVILDASYRSLDEKVLFLRKSNMIPGVVYGKGQKNLSIKIDYSKFLKLFRLFGESHIIDLKLDDREKTLEVLVHDVQKHHLTGDFLHIDFYIVNKNEKVHTKIHLSFIGNSQAVKLGAILEESLKEIEVKVLPKYLVDFIEVDLGNLKEVGDSIRVSDLGIDDSKFDILTPLDSIVAQASKPSKIEEETISQNPEETQIQDEEKSEKSN